MKQTKPKYLKEIITLISDIGKSYPNQPLMSHISIALSDYTSVDLISDKELKFLLEKYKCEKELDMIIPHSTDINDIIKDGMDLNFAEEEDYEI